MSDPDGVLGCWFAVYATLVSAFAPARGEITTNPAGGLRQLGGDVGGDLAAVEAAVFYEDFAGIHAGYDYSR